MEGENIFESK
jgi:hypothetical protein